ncbi:MAG: low specificity L-threonine aldolase [Rhizobiales bacterium]|nr:low specificity L-threonine aldolase [Hyphomicrobiales bacterium]
MNFASDNVYGVHPKILAALAAANDGTAPSYGGDDLTQAAEAKLAEVFETEVKAYLVTTGTAANGLALSAIAPGYGAIICHSEAHVSSDECNAPEFFTGGAKIVGLSGEGGKITPATIEKTLKGFIRGEHDPKPKGVSITNATELGTVYTPSEVRAIKELIAPRGMKLHMDGARFANAVVGLSTTPAELTWKSGVDVLSFGTSKNGAMVGEAVVFFDMGLAEDFAYRRMRGGQLVAKSRYLGAQMLAYLEGDLWLDNARRANALAQRLADGLKIASQVRVAHDVQANEVFAVMPRQLHQQLVAQGVSYHQRMSADVAGQMKDSETGVRLVLSFATPEADVDRFLALVHGAWMETRHDAR